MTDQIIAEQQTFELLAGMHPDGQPVFEKILVANAPQNGHYRLLKSPLFVRGVAAGDLIKPVEGKPGAFELVEHGGNLAIRVFCRGDITKLEQELTPAMDKIGGELDLHNERALVYSIHVSIGFNTIEELLNSLVNEASESMWLYGNVYHEESGEPLNWWQDIAEV